MYIRRKKKLFIIVALLVGIGCLSVGFAAFSTTLNISSSASVSANSDSFKVKFSINKDKLEESSVSPSSKTSGLEAGDAVIDNGFNPTITGLSATFTEPGQYVEYTFYARNEGEYTAYLNSVNFVGEKVCRGAVDVSESMVQSACTYIDISVSIAGGVYNETSPVGNHPLAKGMGEQIKVRLEYGSSGTMADGIFTIEFPDIVLVYSTINDSSYYPSDFDSVENEGTLYSIVRAKATKSDIGVNFKEPAINGVYVNNGTEGNQYPIYYFRGSVTDNHVFFADKCWLILRTTETGGVKLVYNGTKVNGMCGTYSVNLGYGEYNTFVDGDNAVRYYHSDGTNSPMKDYIDEWYGDNLLSYRSYLEDTPWCQETTTFNAVSEFGTLPSNFSAGNVYYTASKRLYYGTPTFSCDVQNQLKVNTDNASNQIYYPIGLITVDEAIFAGLGGFDYNYNTNYSFLVNWGGWVTMTPAYYNPDNNKHYLYTLYLDGQIAAERTDSMYETRPVISIAHDIIVSGGDGNSDNPYIIN